DQDVAGFVGLGLMTTDRMGGIIYNAIEGETVNYNGTDYLYTGPADLKVEYDAAADRTTYTAKIRDDLKFWDGTAVTAKDIMFTYYTYLDPSYVGPSSLSSYDIVGLTNWRTQTSNAVYEKYKEIAEKMLKDRRGDGYIANDFYSEEMYNSFWGWIDEQWAFTVQCIYDYIHSNYAADDYAPMIGRDTYAEIAANEGLMWAYAMRLWGFGRLNGDGLFADSCGLYTWDLVTTFPTKKDFIAVTKLAYDNDPEVFFDTEATGNEGVSIVEYATDKLICTYGPQDAEMGGKGISSIEGIKMIDDYTVSVTLEGYSAPAVYSILGITVTPMHYYGDVNKWDPDNGMYGFERGDLEKVRSLTSIPRGAGPYVFESYQGKVVTFKANPNYYKGEPKIQTVLFKETNSSEIADAIAAGVIDCGETTGSRTRFEEIAGYNSNGEITGDVITTSKVDNLGYGYIGLNASTINVGYVPDSAESKALRKALATVLAVYRDEAYDSYYGEAASVIQYPISNTSWAAPQPSDPDYRIAFSVDAQGNDIYNAKMSAEERYAAAKAAALTWFEAAGYTVENGKVTAAPEGGRTEFEVIIPANGQGDHPSYMVLTMARDAFESIDITLIIHDPADSNVLWDSLDVGAQELWCASDESAIDPDLYRLFHGDNIVWGSNYYHIDDEELNRLIMEARSSDDQSFRKAAYRECLDIIMDAGVIVPAYQRQNCIVFSTQRINIATLTPDITSFWGWTKEIERLQMKDSNPASPFSDVPKDAYYYDAVVWAIEKGVTGGTGNGKFSPQAICTREQIMTFLFAAAGRPTSAPAENPFTDVKPNHYFYNAVMWAVENGVTGGVGGGKFGAGQNCTREQAVTFLWKAMGSPEPSGTVCPFTDVKAGQYYFKAVLWAVENGVTGGVAPDRFGVGMSCTRAQIVTFLYKSYGGN
ncbi:MAG: S-layer homology domain-containing protein, partial [Oscillospiraceae bacterium]|nr:S-layer homology domain-containing protein [Oscillospiraceae bacterium]